MATPARIDAATPEPVLVIGSLPPAGRDLDLLVRPAAAAALAGLLGDEDFHHRRGHVWARFADGRVEVIELIPADTLRLGGDQIERLFAEAQPIDGFGSLLRPAAHHRLLMTARRVAGEARMEAKRRRAATELDEDAWRLARETAPAWRAETVLAELEQALSGSPPRSWRLRSTAARVDRYRRGAVIAITGLDGSGKSTQVERLVETLTKLGYPTVAVWTSLVAHPSLSKVAAPVRALLGHRQHPEGVEELWPPAGEDDDPATLLRERHSWLQTGWVTFVAIMNAWWQLRAVRPHLLRGRIVICDRYMLDSLVHMRYRYGSQRRYRLQLAIIRLLAPKPLRSYLLDVSPETARARNREYTPAQIELRARLYREEYERLGVKRLDGERSREDLSTQIAFEVWSALCAERDDARPLLARLLLQAFRALHRSR
ncbi:MAG: dTMP kinase [Solirubrobacteraceae bacterium]